MDKAKVINEPSLVRDLSTGAILETDKMKLMKYRAAKQAAKEKDSKIESLTERINKLETLIERMITNGSDNA
jgi:hypothetical protein